MGKIDNHKYSIEEAFRECFYSVPDYQREYIWTEKEVHQLLEDINDEIDTSSKIEYFIGTILVSPGETNNHYEVIDGQQRLTTLFLLLCVLRYLFRDDPQEAVISGLISTSYTDKTGEIKTSLKLEPRYENAGEIFKKIVEINDVPDKVRNAIQAVNIPTFGSLENLINAYGIIYRYLNDNYEGKENLKKYWGYLSNNVIFIQISADISSTLKIFETINERGVGLNPMDLLKNLLFTHVKSTEFSKLKDEWKKITKPLEEQKEKPLRFLRYFLMANYKVENKRSDSTVREDEIYEWFSNKQNAAICNYVKQPFDFVRKVISNVEQFLAFGMGKGNDGKDNLNMDNLRKLCGGGFSLHNVLLLSASALSKPLFDHFVKQLESFLFFYIFTKSPTKELERNFSIWADDLREIATVPELLQKKRELNKFLINRFEKSMEMKKNELEDALRRYTLDSMQFYRTRYLLSKISQYVDMAYKGIKIPGSLEEYMSLEVEHILPDTPNNDLRKKFFDNNEGKEYDLYKIKLGNLTLLEKPINIVASNNYFQLKIQEYKKCKNYLTSSIAGLVNVGVNTSITRINEKLKSFECWDASAIDSRQEMLIKLIFEIWKIEEIEVS